MGFTTPCFIRKNTPELRKKLEKLGYRICTCTSFKNAIWLDTLAENGTVHGIGYTDETMPRTVEEECGMYEAETSDIDCGTDEELFLAIAALRDDTDNNQLFTNSKGDWGIYRDSSDGNLPGMDFFGMPNDFDLSHYHKATVNELIEHFKI